MPPWDSPSQRPAVLRIAHAAASQTELQGVFHDTAPNVVFVKLPQGWVFAGCDSLQSHRDVFLDASTEFVRVKLSTGWKFLGTAQGWIRAMAFGSRVGAIPWRRGRI